MTKKRHPLVRTGVAGLDEVLFGGLPKKAAYLVEGEPGTGKTTLALQYLLQGVAEGEKGLFVTLSQSKEDLIRIAASHGFSLDGLEIAEISALDLAREASQRQSILQTADLELAEVMRSIHETVESSNADRVVFDSLFELRLLTGEMLAYRRNLLLLKEFITSHGATALFLDYAGPDLGDRQLEGLAHGIISLDMNVPQYGTGLRRICVGKMRGHAFIEGNHDMTIRTGGIDVFPRVVPELSSEPFGDSLISCGIDEIDHMLGGGMDAGTTALIVGQSGTGKSTLGTAYAYAAAKRGQPAAMFLFEERPQIFRKRSSGLGMDLKPLEDEGKLLLKHFNPAETSPGEFSRAVVSAAEGGAEIIVIDSLTGYLGALPDGRDLITQLHSLLSYLSRQNVLTLLVVAQHGLLGGPRETDVDTSYLADTAILLRYFEEGGDLRRTIAVLKKRHGDHESAIRELSIGNGTVSVAELPSRDAA